jgi:hypothetical protein
MISASEASNDNTIEYNNVHTSNFEDTARDMQNHASNRVERVSNAL